ncbi:MAG: DNA-binding domain-containing protein [Tissierellia bacterium]|nr:DNA-binding domain-containing protein [Tissierellia bacterium]
MVDSNKILLCDESIETLKILDFLIEQKELGDVIDEVGDGNKALEIISSMSPDLVITEYKLAGIDGNEVIRRAKKLGYGGRFIMLSDIKDPEVVSKAYENGASFYISKPINLIEVIHIIKQTLILNKNEKIIDKMRNLLDDDKESNFGIKINPLDSTEREVDRILMSLGIHGMSGYIELRDIVLLSIEKDGDKKNYLLFDLYEEIALRSNQKTKTVEQKIRRSAQKVMDYVAEKGLEDYDSIIFDRFSATLFDFAEIRQHMNFIDGKSEIKGILKMRKFIEGIKAILDDISEDS